MGIDAHIVVRNVPRAIVTDDWLAEKSWRLCESIGAKHFFISDGLSQDEYRRQHDAWDAAFNAHPLYPKYSAWPSRDDTWRAIHAQITADIGEYSLEELRHAIEPVGRHHRDEGDPEPGSVYRDDGDIEIIARPDECLLQINLWGRYYGPDYERGDILTYRAIAEWLEHNLPGCEVWYGGDSSGVTIRRFDEEYRKELCAHLFSSEGRDYFARDWGGAAFRPKACGLCPGGRYRGSQFGSGGSGHYAAFHCAGCGKSVRTDDGGCTWTEEKSND